MLYELQPDIHSHAGILREPRVPGFSETFITGSALRTRPPEPLVFGSSFDDQDPPRGFVGITIPLWSAKLIEVLLNLGVDNFESFDAVMEGRAGVSWDGYKAVNVLGSAAAADMPRSTFTSILPTPARTPLVSFQKLVIDSSKVPDLDLFRLAESPSMFIVSDRLIAALASQAPERGWGVTAFPLETVTRPITR